MGWTYRERMDGPVRGAGMERHYISKLDPVSEYRAAAVPCENWWRPGLAEGLSCQSLYHISPLFFRNI